MSDMRLEYEEALHLSNIWHARWIWARGQADRPYTMTPAKLRLAQAAMAKRDTKVGDLCKELGVTRQTLYRFVDPKGELRADGTKLLKRKGLHVSS
jgi:hypothetical protein